MVEKKNYKPIITLFFVFIIYLAAQFTVLLPIYLFDIDLKNTSTEVIALLNLFPGIVLSVFLYIKYKSELEDDFKDLKKNFEPIIKAVLKYWLLGIFLMIVSNIIITSLFPVQQAGNEVGVRMMFKSSPWVSLISILLIAPFTEELLFRKAVRDVFKSKYFFIFISFLVFGLIHVIGTYEELYDLLFVIPYGVLGGVLAALYYKTNNIYSCMLSHFLHNLFGVLLIVFFA